MCVAEGATDSDRRESSVPKINGLSETHDSSRRAGARCAWNSQVVHSSETCSPVSPAGALLGRSPIDLGSLISTMGGHMGIGLPMVI